MNQNHLNLKQTINLGSYYTPEKFISKCYEFLQQDIKNCKAYSIVDTSCGYGNFLNNKFLENSKNKNFKKIIGADIDKKAIQKAKENNPNIQYFHLNSLWKVSRKNYALKENDKIIIIGNPPYNDSTSIIRQKIKNKQIEIDKDILLRDLGMSFLLSYAKLKADYICVLHPLSYLIKKSNFKMLKKFTSHYQLINALVFNSQEFQGTSKITGFPILIAFYKKHNLGMDYHFIKNFSFPTLEGKSFCLNDYCSIENFITKYPNQKNISLEKTLAYFWTMRDINALKRSRTFVEKESSNTIRIEKDKMNYYCYVDVFKKFIPHMPYYFGNSNVFLDLKEYEKIKEEIKLYSFSTNPILKKNFKTKEFDFLTIEKKVKSYFQKLLGEHYVY